MHRLPAIHWITKSTFGAGRVRPRVPPLLVMFAASGYRSQAADSAGLCGPASSGLPPRRCASPHSHRWLAADPLEGNMRRNDVDHGMITDLIEHIARRTRAAGGGRRGAGSPQPPRQVRLGDQHIRVEPEHRTGLAAGPRLDDRPRRLNLPSTSGASKEPMSGKVTVGALSFMVVGVHHAASTTTSRRVSVRTGAGARRMGRRHLPTSSRGSE